MHTYAGRRRVRPRRRARCSSTPTASAYLDFLAGLAVTSLGHAHPAVADAIADQARTLLHVSNLFGNELAPDVARDHRPPDRWRHGPGRRAGVLRQLGRRGQRVRASSSPGAAAGAGRHVVVSAYGSFHGRTLATLHRHRPAREARAVRSRCPRASATSPYGDLAALDAALDPERVAAVLLEPIQGEGGVIVPALGYLGAVRELCNERGVLLMLDEIQTGLGRTGRWFGFQAQGLEPDVVTLAKALGNGMPVGACWARAEVGGRLRARRPRLDLRRPAARAVGGRGRRSTSWSARTCCGRAQRAGSRCRRPARLPGVVVGPRRRACSLAAAARRAGSTQGRGRSRRSSAGSLVNAVRPDAVRLAPPLLVSDAELDEARRILAALAECRDARPEAGLDRLRRLPRRRRPRPDDCDARPRRCAERTRPARRSSPARGGAGLREAVGPHPQLRPRWRSSTSAATRSTSRAPRSASTRARPSRTSPAPSPATTVLVRPGVRPRHARADGGRLDAQRSTSRS